MTAHKNSQKNNSSTFFQGRLIRLYFFLPILEAAIAIAAVFASPSEGNNVFLLGLSKTRWMLVFTFLVIGIPFVLASLAVRGNSISSPRFKKRIAASVENPAFYWLVALLSLVGTVVFFYLAILTFKFTDEFVQPRLLRLLPLIFFLLVLCLQNLIFLPLLNHGKKSFTLADVLRPATVALGFLSLCVLLISLTRLGLEPDRTGWDTLGVPLMATQILIAWLVAFIVYAAIRIIEKKTNWKLSRLDWLICVSLWLLAIFLWQAQPLTPTFFSPTPRLPNSEFYPYSDAATHDLIAQNLLIGEGFGSAAEKPLYSFFLAVAHALVGQSYLSVVILQIIVLALFPPILYLIGGEIHHRLSGLILAMAVILRELNTIALSGQIDVSHSKLLMTDLPTALGLAFLALVLFRWLKSDLPLLKWPLWIGGALGVLVLLRSQTLIFLPILLTIAFWRNRKNLRSRMIYAGLLLFGFILVVTPWMARNAVHTGQFGFSQPLQALYLAKQYSFTPQANDPGFPTDTPISEYVSLGFAHVLEFARNNPAEVTRFVSAHFLHNEVSSFLALPIRFDFSDKIVTFYNLRPYSKGAEARLWADCCSLDSHIENSPYWQDWDGMFPHEARLPIVVNLVFVAIGLGAAWERHRWVGLLPLGLHLIYNLSTAIARVSGWRLNLPVDWVLLLYYCLGIGQLTIWAWSYLSSSKTVRAQKEKKAQKTYGLQKEKLIQPALAILFIGLLLPFSEIVIPEDYEKIDKTQAVVAWQQSDLATTPLNMSGFLEQPGAVVLNGRALWPRYYAANVGEPGGQWAAFNSLPFARLGFVLIGPQGNQIILPLRAAPPAFPNASDVIVYGCSEENYLRAIAVVFPDYDAPDLLTDLSSFSCKIAP